VEVIVLEPSGAERRRLPLLAATHMLGVARDGTLLVLLQIGGGVFGLAAIDPTGRVLWQTKGSYESAFLAADGVVIAYGADVRAMDLATGETRWTITPPSKQFVASVCDAALTSAGTIVALQCNGTAFVIGD
jgi:hypothetical protein